MGYPNCGGSIQSPLNINDASIQEEEIEELTLINYEDVQSGITIVNNGHTGTALYAHLYHISIKYMY